MIVRKIALNGWRNYEFAAAEFSPGTNVITGENAQGKTNLLEAVYLLTGGKSFRTRFDKELIGFGYTSAEVLADVFAFGREQTVRIVLRQGQRKQIWQNGVKKTAAELAGTFAAVQAVLANASCPVVVDADGINVLEGHIDVLRGAACPVVLTPHDGEYRRLMGRLPGEDRMGAAAALAEKTGATVLLKGHRTAICGADERWENRCGNPGLATGGSGDVLAGILVSLLGQGLPPVHAAAAAAWLHGTAADRCAARMGEYGLLPSDVAAELPYLLP